MKQPTNFKELVTFSTWQVVEGITKGQALEGVMHCILDAAMRLSQQWHKPSASASEWVRVDERTPKHTDGEVLVRMPDGSFLTALPDFSPDNPDELLFWSFSDPSEERDPTHWMAIPQLTPEG